MFTVLLIIALTNALTFMVMRLYCVRKIAYGQIQVAKTQAPLMSGRHLPAVPICGCGHAFSFHSPTEEHKPCKYMNRGKYQTFDKRTMNRVFGGWYEGEKCSCVQYVGPLPLPEFMALEA